MNVPSWKPTWWRRVQLAWILPYLLIAYLPVMIYIGVREVGNPFDTLGDVWSGRR